MQPNETRHRRRMLTTLLVAMAALLALAVGACGDDDGGTSADGGSAGEFDLRGTQVTVGSKEFTEQLILGQITKKALEAAGADVGDQIGLEGSVAARRALTSGDIDLYWEYTGTGWVSYLNRERGLADAQQQFDAIKRADAANGVDWIDLAPMNNTYAIAVRSDAGDPVDGVQTLSDLAALARSDPDAMTICVGEEFATRSDGLRGVERTYGFSFDSDKTSLVGDAVVYNEVGGGDRCNFGSVFATDGRIQSQSLRVLRDDKRFFPFFNAALTVRSPALRESPEIERLFAPVAEALTDEAVTDLNARVDVEGETPEDVAEEFLRDQGVIG